MFKYKLFILVVVLLDGALPLVAEAQFRIGAIMALSGNASHLGHAAQNGMLLALDSLPEEDRSRLRIAFEDDGFLPSRTVGAFKKLVDIDKVNALICWSSGSCKAIAAMAEQAAIPLIAIASDDTASRGRSYVVNFWVTPETEAEIMVQEALRRKYKSLGIISAIWDGAVTCKKAFRERAKDDFKIVLDEELPSDIKDFKTIIPRILATKPDALLTILAPGQQGIFARQLRQAKIMVDLFGFETFEDETEIRNAEGALNGTWFATASAPSRDFEQQYKSRYPGASMVTANNAHDAILLLAAASRGNGGNPSAITQYLHTVKDFSGACGTFSATSDNKYSLPAVLREINNNGVRPLTTIH